LSIFSILIFNSKVVSFLKLANKLVQPAKQAIA